MSELHKQCLETRETYIELIKKELLGPGSEVSIPDEEHELISTSPDTRYSIGILFPRNDKLNADNDDPSRVEESYEDTDSDTEDDINGLNESENIPHYGIKSKIYNSDAGEDKLDEDDKFDDKNLDEEISLTEQNMPSSCGLTFLSSTDLNRLTCKVEFATYKRALTSDCKIPFYPDDPQTYEVVAELSPYVYYDRSDNCLKVKEGFTRSKIWGIYSDHFRNGENRELLDPVYKLADQLKSGFIRIPHSVDVLIDFNDKEYVDNNRGIDGVNVKITALKHKIDNDLYSFTIMLVNDNDYDGRSIGTRCIFQPKIRIYSEPNGFVFKEYSSLKNIEALDDEEQSLELQYRNKRIYGTGLGTSVNWDIDNAGNGFICNDFFPEVDVPSMDFAIPGGYSIDNDALSMRFLSDLDKTDKKEKISKLNTVVDAYGNWISNLEAREGVLDIKYHSAACKNIDGCKASRQRMSEGLNILANNDNAWTAFELANRAMFMQRVHLEIQNETSDDDRYPGDKLLADIMGQLDYSELSGYTDDKYYWRLFQIAFLLMSIDGIVDDKSSNREIVDLIWFPTGGGKTEAYLGLTAFTIFYRRLAHADVSDGTTVIMRYTLRLLAAQQFTRASTLICACEYIRFDATSKHPKYGKYNLGSSEINIGLWIGGEHTPNTNAKAKILLKKLQDSKYQDLDYNKEQYNKFQVLKCPWCGTKMVKDRVDNKMRGSFGYRMSGNKHFELYCPQESCFFGQRDRLPIQIVDEELYNTPPTLLFGTVDKFAMLPWKNQTGAFFAAASDNRAPELIIQDELHLISGPLGTMVGLYETAIDFLCRKKGTCAKIVASTATIRRAGEQCSALYNRDVSQFPHPGLDAEDSFFAREKKIDYSIDRGYGRKYVGLMPSGKTKAMMEIRSIAALMQRINTMDLSDDIKDNFWTLTVYFNSLKDLGKCSTLVDDDVKDFIKRMAYRLGNANDVRQIGKVDELTSRVKTTELNLTLDKLEKVHYTSDNIANRRFPSNVLLATNMISVGIDIPRLNVMLMVGQPKLTSEYIQASSRIGRDYPGVVFTLYDGSKSRDRSHYEQFKSYHEAFYKFVEPTGATPFAKPARDRALHAVVIAMIRLYVSELSSEDKAGDFRNENYKEVIDKIQQYIVNRSNDISQHLNSGIKNDSEEIEVEIRRVFEKWDRWAQNKNGHFYYGERFMVKHPTEDEGRLMKPFNSDGDDQAIDTMTSMRNVDAAVAGNVIIWEK